MIKKCHKGMTEAFPRHYKLATLRQIPELRLGRTMGD